MCGIVAVFSTTPCPARLDRLRQMNDAIKHRGPDDEGYAVFSGTRTPPRIYAGVDTPPNVIDSRLPYTPGETFTAVSGDAVAGMSHRRLSILDLSAAGHQPMSTEDGRYWISYNGEVYNYPELRKELIAAGWQFSSSSDTEVVLKAWLEWGPDALSRFNGMWALVIWDDREKTIFAARDRLGVKPLYYYRDEMGLIFSSEIKSIQKAVSLEPFEDEVYSYLVDGPDESQSQTPFRKVFRFPAAHYCDMPLSKAGLSLRFQRYWTMPIGETRSEAFREDRCEELIEEYTEKLRDAVELRLRADVDVGAALSGGLDSSSIVYMVNQLRRDQRSNRKLLTFSTIYPSAGAEACDESQFISLLSERLCVENHGIEPRQEDIWAEHENMLRSMDTLPANTLMSSWHTFKLPARHGIKVNLDGQGADEQLTGYDHHWWLHALSDLNFDPRSIAMDHKLSGFKRHKLIRRLLRFGPLSRRLRDALHHHKHRSFYPLHVSPEYLEQRRESQDSYGEPLEQVLAQETVTALPTLLHYLDRTSMAHGIESRTPFVDVQLIEFLARVPLSYKIHDGWNKYLARRAFAGRLPYEITWRRDKMGWPIPEARWLQGELAEQADASIRRSELLRPLGVERLIELRSGHLDQYIRCWNLARWEEINWGSVATQPITVPTETTSCAP